MRGVPADLNTRADYERCQELARNGELRHRDMQRLREHWAGMLEGRHYYAPDRVLDDGEDPDGSEPEYLVREVEDEETGDVRRQQFVRTERDPSALTRTGFTVQEVEDAISELEGMING
ncbi:hypothetical protein [Halorhodospira neutriphila]|uniref:Uncharacterized protein n=1 Tax=Halorhodospira neutriphila TaxID=168379 RepID=A0ABS1E2K9_9GAMM|nr:hypothetical protein [Halorhodospira neutriphila]MBK1725720.1 hypothetical protein [Halorhodospira neutriphila]